MLPPGVMVRPGYGGILPNARLLGPDSSMVVADETVPATGADVTRGFRSTRRSDGSTAV